MLTVGITALVPPEIIYATGNISQDINNFVPKSKVTPKDKLCAWTAVWRDLALMGKIGLDRLVVVAGGDCNNATVDGERLERSGIETYYFTYPFNGSPKAMQVEIEGLIDFLGGVLDETVFQEIMNLKKMAMDIDESRVRDEILSSDAFEIIISGSDLCGDMDRYKRIMEEVDLGGVDYDHRIALLGTPPVYSDFHNFLESLGLHVVYDEMPYEFIRHSGSSLESISMDYSEYTFARNISFRIEFLKKELKRRKVDGIIHFHQFACHHKLEDPILRDALCREGYPFITIEADLPSKTTQQARLRLEAYKERLGEYS